MWFKRICAVIFLMGSISEAKVYLWPVGMKVRAERDENQNLDARFTDFPSLAAGFRVENWLVNLEASQYRNSSNDGNVEIKTTYNETALGIGYSLFQGEIWDIFGTAGVGAYHQKVKTGIGGLSTTSRSNDEALFNFGAEFILDFNAYFCVSAGGRINMARDLDPDVSPEGFLRIGIGF